MRNIIRKILRISVGIFVVGLFALTGADAFIVTSTATSYLPDSVRICWYVTPEGSESFKDFHVTTDDGTIANYANSVKPVGWFFDVTTAGNGHWINFYGGTAQASAFSFCVTYKGKLNVSERAACHVTNDGNGSPEDGVLKTFSGKHAPCFTRVPSLTNLGLILLMIIVILSGIIVMRYKKRTVAI